MKDVNEKWVYKRQYVDQTKDMNEPMLITMQITGITQRHSVRKCDTVVIAVGHL